MNLEYLKSIWEKAKSGITVEIQNVELKRQWWDLKTQAEEFGKDICLMSNNQSGDSYIIIGMDENGVLYEAKLPDDEANIQQKIKSLIDPLPKIHIEEFILNNVAISVITIPHSINRPHLLKKYGNRENWIPIRFGTTTLTASRADLDAMYQERAETTSPKLKVEISDLSIEWARYSPGWGFAVKLTIDNSQGTAPEYINMISLKETTGEWESKFYRFDSATRLNDEYMIGSGDRKTHVIFYLSNEPFPPPVSDPIFRPRLDTHNMKLTIGTVNSGEIMIDLKPEWFSQYTENLISE